jgi:hypothetical protein
MLQKKYISTVISSLIPLLIFFISVRFVLAADLIPCDGTAAHPCGFDELLQLVENVMHFLLFDMVLPISAILFAYVGFLFLTSGSNPGNRDKAKKILWKLVAGLVISLSAWLIIRTILVTLGYDNTIFPRIL